MVSSAGVVKVAIEFNDDGGEYRYLTGPVTMELACRKIGRLAAHEVISFATAQKMTQRIKDVMLSDEFSDASVHLFVVDGCLLKVEDVNRQTANFLFQRGLVKL